ncbi:MAG: hypothetical protein ACP5LE_04540 [Thermoplasmata archaeon]
MKNLDGRKKYEFRKTFFKKDVDEVYVYATMPIGKIVCKFRVGKIICEEPERLWENFGNASGLTEDEFFAYFRSRKKRICHRN